MKEIDRMHIKANCTTQEIELLLRSRSGLTSEVVCLPLAATEQLQQRFSHAVDCIKRLKQNGDGKS